MDIFLLYNNVDGPIWKFSPAVCLSVTLQYCAKTAKCIVEILRRLFLYTKFGRVHLQRGLNPLTPTVAIWAQLY